MNMVLASQINGKKKIAKFNTLQFLFPLTIAKFNTLEMWRLTVREIIYSQNLVRIRYSVTNSLS